MIGYISGTIIAKTDILLVNVGGVGYEVFVPQPILFSATTGSDISLYTTFIVREQEWRLFGFSRYEEKVFFEHLLTVSGVGPKTALVFFDSDVSLVAQAIMKKDDAYISSFKGIGKKTAERIVLDLQGKILPFESFGYESLYATLEGLGFHAKDIRVQFLDAPEGMNDEEAIRWFLSHR